MTNSSLLLNFISNLEQVNFLRQMAVIALCLALAWGLSKVLLKRIAKSENSLNSNINGISRVLFPLIALLLIYIGRHQLQNWYSVNLLNIAIPLLFALMFIRLAAYVLRQVISPGRWLMGSEHIISLSIWLLFALHLTGALPEIIKALDYLSFHIGQQKISLLIVLNGILAIALTLLLALWIGKTLEQKIMLTENLDVNLRVILSKLTRAILIFLGILIALPLAGIDITVLSVFGGALGVGIGFGLQKIASNYVSGFIILLDHSIHLGDVLTVDGRFGKVAQLTTHYIVLHNGDGTEAIIPNETMISSTVINHSYSNRDIRIGIPIQISYQSDLQLAMNIMKQAAANQPRVLSTPEIKVYLKSFGDNGIDLEMGI